jgi:hypothetical protein
MRDSTTLNRFLFFFLLVALLGGLVYANMQFSRAAPGGNDFLARWMGARYWLLDGVNPYDEEVSLATQNVVYGRPADPEKGEDIAAFAYPLTSMLFFAPFGYMNYTLARAIWMTILELCLPVLTLVSIRIADWTPSRRTLGFFLLFSVIWYHGFRAVVLGQFAVIEALLMAGALLAIKRQSDSLAGVLLGLTISKPQMVVLLIPFVLIWAVSMRRWKIIGWTLGTIIGQVVLFLIVMPDWPMRWLQQVFAYPGYTSPGSPVSVLFGYLSDSPSRITMIVSGILLVYLAWEWFRALAKPDRWFQWTAALTIVITTLVSPRTATTNFLAMFPAFCIILWTIQGRWSARANLVVLLLLIVLLIVPWTVFILTVDGYLENPVMHPPLPILTFAGLLWVRWWFVQAPSLIHRKPAA